MIFHVSSLGNQLFGEGAISLSLLTAAGRARICLTFFKLVSDLASASSSVNQFHSNNICWQWCGMLLLSFLTPWLVICFCAI